MHARRFVGGAALAAAALLWAAAPAEAQRVVDGFLRVNQSDVTGPAVTSGDQLNFEPGTVQSVSCAAAWGIRTEGRKVDEALYRLVLAPADTPARVLWEGAQRDVARLLAGGPGARAAGRSVAAALSPASNRGARGEARRLVVRLEGLLGAVGRMDPRDPGRGAPTRLYESVGAWDDFVDASSAPFLAAPPDEMLAIQAVLARLDRAAIEHAARDGDTEAVDAFGLACAPPPAPVAVEEIPFEVCVLAEGDFRWARGLFVPATGDSLAEAGGARRPFAEAYPGREGYAAGLPWFARDTPVVVGGREYRQWGMSRVVTPGELAPSGTHRGVPVFVAPGERTPPDVIYLPFRPGCEVQPYRRSAEYRRVRG